MRWRVIYVRPHRKVPTVERQDLAEVESDAEPTVEQVAEATGDTVLSIVEVAQIEEEP